MSVSKLSLGQSTAPGTKGPGKGTELIKHKKMVNVLIKKEVRDKLKNIRDRMLLLSRLYNGRDPANPSSRIQLHQPLSPAIPQIVQEVQSEVSGVENATSKALSEVMNIYNEQNEYASTRPAVPQQIAQASSDSNYSTAVGRLFTRVITPFLFGDIDRWDRKNMLISAAQGLQYLKDTEDSLVTRGPTIRMAVLSAKEAYDTMNTAIFEHVISAVQKEIDKRKSSEELSETPRTTESSSSDPQSSSVPESQPNFSIENISKMKLEVDNSLSQRKQIDVILAFYPDLNAVFKERKKYVEQLYRSLRPLNAPEIVISQGLESRLQELYSQYISALSSLYNDVIAAKAAQVVTAGTIQYDLEKLAHNYLSRLLKRKYLELKPIRDPDRNLRLAGAEKCRQSMNNLDKLMNVLQTPGKKIYDLLPILTKFIESFSGLFIKLAELAESYNNKVRLGDWASRTEKPQLVTDSEIRDLRRKIQALQERFGLLNSFTSHILLPGRYPKNKPVESLDE